MSQEQDILYHLHNISPLTPLDALNLYGCLRLSARIDDLRRQGHNIETKIVERNGKRFAEYKMRK